LDPVSVGMLAALAGGAGGELGRQAWAALSELVRRPFGRRASAVTPGEPELVALSEAPGELGRACRRRARSGCCGCRRAARPV
jgi:hypothetical protein